MKRQNKIFRAALTFASFFFMFASCSSGNDFSYTSGESVRQIKVAVVLPTSSGNAQAARYHRIADWYLSTLSSAIKSSGFSVPYTLNLEWHDEDAIDIAGTAETLSKRSDVMSVIGPLTSDHLQVFAEKFYETKKPLIAPSATSESVIRAFAINSADKDKREPFLWALTEPDISQAEALLAKVAAYGGKKIALLTCANIYGKTFFEWTPFLASELGLTLLQSARYKSENTGTDFDAGTPTVSLEAAVNSVFSSGAEYALCVLASDKDAGAILAERERLGDKAPYLLFTDAAFTEDFLRYGDKAEGVEGTAPFADPTSGFAVEYLARFNENLSLGEAHLYDSLLLCGLAAARLLQNEKSEEQAFSNAAANEAIKSFSGSGQKGVSAWSQFGMALALRSVDSGERVNVDGATGLLDFDAETSTSASRSVYAHWVVSDNSFVTLDFTSSDGTGRTAANTASWEWNASFDGKKVEATKGVSIEYKELKSRWAVIVAASKGWGNYRHQADALHLYQLLKRNGYDDNHIILIIADDIAASSRNKQKGKVFSRLNGENLYTNIEIDYLLSELTADDIAGIMQGGAIQVDHNGLSESHPFVAANPTVLDTDEHSNVLWFWSGHGSNRNGNSKLGQFEWEGKGSDDFTTELMGRTLSAMKSQKRFRKLLVASETCYSGSVLNAADGIDGAIAFTATNGSESSLADVYSVDMKVWLSNRFTRNFIDMMASNKNVAYADLYKNLVQHTIGSHVQMFNASRFENLYLASPAEFF